MTLAFIPARGGSRGVPRKNLRMIAGRPLVLIAADTAREAGCEPVVITDNNEIAAVARLAGIRVMPEPVELAGDDVGLADVMRWATQGLDPTEVVAVIQPTCPQITPGAVRRLVYRAEVSGRAAVAAARRTHQTYERRPEGWVALLPRLPRQSQPVGLLSELGVFAAPAGRYQQVDPYRDAVPVLVDEPVIDIDTPADLEAARVALTRRHVHFEIVASRKLGLGHLWRAVSLAGELAHHDVTVGLVDGSDEEMAARIPDSLRLSVSAATAADLVVCDRLDTDALRVMELRRSGARVVCFEDLGGGSDFADLVINELWADARGHAVCGPRWAVLRPEFAVRPERPQNGRVLVGFGGTDAAGLTHHVAGVLSGRGVDVAVLESGWSVAEQMAEADVMVSSCGRMLSEAAATGLPVVGVAVNERESRHYRLAGGIYLGLFAAVSDEQLGSVVVRLLDRPELRVELGERLASQFDGLGSRRIVSRIDGLLEGL